MPRKGLRVITEVTIQAVTCPGVRLPLEHDVFLSICLMGHHVHTKSLTPIFPLVFKERLKFYKTYICCSDVQQLDCALREENVVLELVRDDRVCNKMVVLAIAETCLHNFLFPQPGLRPTYSTMDNEIIMDPTNDFCGVIGPKVEFSTMTTIKETYRPELDCLNDKVCCIDECRPCPRRCSSPCTPVCSLPCSPPCQPICPPVCRPSCPSLCSDPCPPRCPSPRPAMEYSSYCRELDRSYCGIRTSSPKDYQICGGCLRSCSTPRFCSPRICPPRSCVESDICDPCNPCNRRSPSPNRKRYVHVDTTDGRPLASCTRSRC